MAIHSRSGGGYIKYYICLIVCCSPLSRTPAHLHHLITHQTTKHHTSHITITQLVKAQAGEQAMSNLTSDSTVYDVGLGLDQQEELTDKAVLVIRRVMDKLTGLDFNKGGALGSPRENMLNSARTCLCL